MRHLMEPDPNLPEVDLQRLAAWALWLAAVALNVVLVVAR